MGAHVEGHRQSVTPASRRIPAGACPRVDRQNAGHRPSVHGPHHDLLRQSAAVRRLRRVQKTPPEAFARPAARHLRHGSPEARWPAGNFLFFSSLRSGLSSFAKFIKLAQTGNFFLFFFYSSSLVFQFPHEIGIFTVIFRVNVHVLSVLIAILGPA